MPLMAEMCNRMTIFLREIWVIENTSEYKIHFARHDKSSHPLEVWVRSKSEWQDWQEYWPGRNDFNQPYIFSLMQFYHEPETWLFGGVFKVIERCENSYKVELTDMGENFIGRLKIKSSYKERTARTYMEPHYSEFEVKEILSEPYTGRAFPGFEEIDLSFEELETLIRNDRLDWKTALGSMKGIYLLTDTKTNKRYVGSAYGDAGIWSRWRCYIETGHGGNVGIHQLINGVDIDDDDYCRRFFRFALLENRPFNTPDEKIQSREAYWKRILLTRGETGLNHN